MNPQFPECNQCPKHYCCFNRPGAYAPEDFTVSDKATSFYEMRVILTPLLQEGTLVIDVWPGDPRRQKMDYRGLSAKRTFDFVYYVRPNTTKNPQPYIIDTAMIPDDTTARCIYYDEGCSLPHLEQPMQCFMRVPVPGYKCVHTHTRREIMIDWLDFQPLLRQLVKDFSKDKRKP